MTRTSREPTLAFENMKQPFEKRFWDFVLQPIADDTVQMIMATVWLCVFVGIVLIAFTLMGPEVVAP